MKFLPNLIKSNLEKGTPVIGSWLNLPDLSVTEIMARSGFDFLAIDAEHGSISYSIMKNMVAMIESYHCIPLVRVAENDPVVIKKVLETGAYGVIVPMINSAEEAKQAVDSVYYPPRGIRGVGLARAQGYGMEFQRYKGWHEDNLIVIPQIEHIDGIRNLEEILSVEGVNGTMIGPYDLSASMGCPGEFDREEVQEALKRYEEVSKEKKVPFGYHVVHPEQELLSSRLAKGYTFLVYGIDEIFLQGKCNEVIGHIKEERDKNHGK